jgi:hypothetical protein
VVAAPMSDVVLVPLTEEERAALGRLPAIAALLVRLEAGKSAREVPAETTSRDLLSPRLVGKLCGCNAETVRTAVVMGFLHAITVQRARGGRQGLLISRAEALAWLAKGRPVR